MPADAVSRRFRLTYEGITGPIVPGEEGTLAGSTALTGREAMAAKLDVVVDPIVGGEELLRVAGRFEPLHVALPPSGWLM